MVARRQPRARAPRRNPRRRASRPLPRVQSEARLRTIRGVTLMRREGMSLRAAALQSDTTPRTMLKYARQALRKRDGVYYAIPIDELRRPMRVLTEGGIAVVNVRSSGTASRLATYWNAVDTYLRTGDRRALAPFVGRRFSAEGQVLPFITDSRLLDRLANAGQVSFEEIYESTA